MSFGSKQTTTQKGTSSTSIDPTLQGRQDDVYARAQALADRPFQSYDPNQRFADFNGDQVASFEAARAAAGAGTGELNDASGIAGRLGTFGGPQVGFQGSDGRTVDLSGRAGAGSIYDRLGAGGGPGSAGGRDIMAQKFTDANLNEYMNPFISSVVDRSLGDVERSRQEAINTGQGAATAAKAFGGSRHGVADSLTNREFANTAANTSANLRKAGFDAAAGLIQGDQNRNLQAQASNQGKDVATSSANLTAGIASRGQNLQALTTDQAARQREQESLDRLSSFNAGQLQNADQFNSTGQLNADSFNASGARTDAGIQSNAAAQLAAFGQQRQQMGARGADLLSRIGGQQQGLDQARKDFGYDQFQQEQNRPYQNLDLLQRILSAQRYGQTQNTTGTTTQENKQGAGGALLSGALTLGGLAFGGPAGAKVGSAIGGGVAPAEAPAPNVSPNWLQNLNLGAF